MKKHATQLVLKQNPIFGKLPEARLAELAEMSTIRQYQPGELVFCEGDAGNFLYGVIAGCIRIHTTAVDGRALNLNRIQAGDIIGEIAFLDGGPRTASGEASETTTCFRLPRPAFMAFLEQHPKLAIELLRLVCERVRWVNVQVADFAFLTPAARLARRLTQLLTLNQPPSAVVAISQAELASFLGLSRQVVNSYLRTWQTQGAVTLSRGAIQINSVEQLLEISGLPEL